MRLTVDRHAFAAALAQAAKYAPTRGTIPILSAVLLRASDGELEVTVTDLDLLYRASIEAHVDVKGAVAANAVLLAGFARGAGGADITMALDGSLLAAGSGHARARIPTQPVADFPTLFASPAKLGFDIDGVVLAACLEAVGYAVEKDNKGLYYLCGISWLIQDGRLELCATDGHILSVVNIEMPAGAGQLQPVIVPDFAMPTFTGPVRVEVADTFIRFSGNAGHRVSLASKLVDGRFPDYRRIIRPTTATATVKRKALANAVGRCLPLCKAGLAAIDLIHDGDGKLVVSVNSNDGAEIEDRIDIGGSQFALSLGGSLLAATLDSFSAETIEIGLVRVGDGVRFREPGKDHRLAIVMPMHGTVTHRIGPPANYLDAPAA